ncbi:uncharacterized protein LOC125673334 isoform X2 [Ostrea edulis]|uniref:uncharacterized protein LOC125673334 isoform X2 n=1 Tax=Ostrea edulis TaxID=37623 RepID=UPI0024AFE5C0|nr:uncharacterized protein LOC125673334 isoform X2 [Ostrea edulis]
MVDTDIEPNDEYYSDLLKFWRRHKIYMGKDMMSTITAAQAKKKAKQRGRRKSHEFEDLDFNRKTGKVIPVIAETEEDHHSGEDPVKSSPEGTPKLKKRSVAGHSKVKNEEEAVKSSPEESPKLKKRSVAGHSKVKNEEEAVKSSPEGTPKIKKRSVVGHSKVKNEEEAVKSSPEESPKLKKKSMTDHSKMNGKVTNSERKRESSAKSTKNSTKLGQSGAKTPIKSTVQRKISDPAKSKK